MALKVGFEYIEDPNEDERIRKILDILLPGQISQGTLIWSKTAIQFEKILKNTARTVQKGPVLPEEGMAAIWARDPVFKKLESVDWVG